MRLAPAAGPYHGDFQACRADITADCLIDLGTRMVTERDVPAANQLPLSNLALIGRFDEVRTILMAYHAGNGLDQVAAAAKADDFLLARRIAVAVRNGSDVARAIRQTPGVGSGSQFWTAALFLKLARNDNSLSVAEARAFAKAISDAPSDNPSLRDLNQIRAAKLMAGIGDRGDALTYLDRLTEVPQSNTPPDVTLTKIVGLDAISRYFEPRDRLDAARTQLRNGKATEDPDRARAMFDRAFTIYEDRAIAPDYAKMLDVVRASAEQGLSDQSLGLARRVDRSARQGNGIFPVFPDIHAARALISAGAPDAEIRSSVQRALTALVGDDPGIVGFGLVSGLIDWDRSGLSRQARYDLARIHIELGDPSTAVMLLEDIDQPYQAWQDALPDDVSPDALPLLLDGANRALDHDHVWRLKVQIARRYARDTPDQDRQDWIASQITDLLARDPMQSQVGIDTYESAIAAVRSLDRPNLERLVVRHLGKAALRTRDPQHLLKAGIAMHMSGP